MKKNNKSSNQLNPSLSRVRKLLSEAAFNPRTPGIMNIITNAGNPSYFETRALEFISEAQIIRSILVKDVVFDNYKKEMISAIRMLITAILKVEDGEV